MINRQALLADLQKFLQRIEADLLERSESTEVPEVPAALHAEYEGAAKAKRTAQNYEDWRTDTITQAAAAWVLSCVFVRFLEDNSLIDPPKIAGPGDRLARARDEHELYFRSHPQHTDREYLLSIFAELAKLPGTKDIFGEHNAINDLPNWLSGDAAGELLNFFQKIDASTGDLVHDFTDSSWDTRFLGDLYQDLSEAARKKFALLQTPDFVEEFILDRTLDPAIEEFGLVTGRARSIDDMGQGKTDYFKMIDPACGSGHFLLGSFPRILNRWLKMEPGTNIRELVQRTLNSIHGVDINPFAIAIARFRLLLAALNACDITRLVDAPGFHMNLACGDSLYHGRQKQMLLQGVETDESHYFKAEDTEALNRILKEGTYHAVVANPPYIMPNDRAANKCYRDLYPSCHLKFSMAVPFAERIFNLGLQASSDFANGAYTGQITANSFSKKEAGRKLVSQFFPRVKLTHIIDSSLAHIPSHGTPTMILFGRSGPPDSSPIRTAMGIKREDIEPTDPSQGLVWQAICKQLDEVGSESEFLTVLDLPRDLLAKHPWSISGGGVSDVKTQMTDAAIDVLGDHVDSIGITVFTLLDDIFVLPPVATRRKKLPSGKVRLIVEGDSIRDWSQLTSDAIVFPYDDSFRPTLDDATHRYLWVARSTLSDCKVFAGKTKVEAGSKWFEFGRLTSSKLKTPRAICFAEVATHNHFVFDCDGKLYKKTAPIIKLRKDADNNRHIELLGLLNSSAGCFWMKQVFPSKGGGGIGGGIAAESWERFFEFRSNGLREFPVVRASDRLVWIVGLIRDAFLRERDMRPDNQLCRGGKALLNSDDWSKSIQAGVRLQEDLDWECYRIYGLVDENLAYKSETLGIQLGERAFEIVMARKIAAGKLSTTWFERHSSTPTVNLPEHWPEDYKALVNRRIEIIESNPSISILEQPEYKRRWSTEPWESQLERALREWLLLRLETYFDSDGRMTDETNASKRGVPLVEIAMYSIGQLADAARRDPQFMEVGELYRDDPAFDVQVLVEELLFAESVPHLPILRYKDSGLRKRAEWEKTWELQRREDAGESVGTIPVPPKYTSADFISTGGARYWSLRGKLDVPKERWISFPHCEGPDGTLVICWAGYDHLQQAQAISAYYVRVQTEFGGSEDSRLIPLLASLIELLPWLKQWHNEPNANFDGLRMGDYFEGFVNEEARNLGKTLAEIKAWVPPKKAAKSAAPKSSTKKTITRKVAEEASHAEAEE